MRPHLAALVGAALLAWSTASHAQQSDPPEAAAVATAADSPAPRTVGFTVNPLSALLGQWGANAELSLAPHHSAVGSLAYLRMNDDLALKSVEGQPERVGPAPLYAARATGCVGEIGYRYYPDARRMKGLFFSPSLLLAGGTMHGSETRSFRSVGAAFDIGGQVVTSGGFVFALGVGVYGLLGTPRLASGGAASAWTTSGVAPRLLLSLGWAI